MDDADYAAIVMFSLGIAGVVIIIIMEVMHRKKMKALSESEGPRQLK
jgi:hypothetical protein